MLKERYSGLQLSFAAAVEKRLEGVEAGEDAKVEEAAVAIRGRTAEDVFGRANDCAVVQSLDDERVEKEQPAAVLVCGVGVGEAGAEGPDPAYTARVAVYRLSVNG